MCDIFMLVKCLTKPFLCKLEKQQPLVAKYQLIISQKQFIGNEKCGYLNTLQIKKKKFFLQEFNFKIVAVNQSIKFYITPLKTTDPPKALVCITEI